MALAENRSRDHPAGQRSSHIREKRGRWEGEVRLEIDGQRVRSRTPQECGKGNGEPEKIHARFEKEWMNRRMPRKARYSASGNCQDATIRGGGSGPLSGERNSEQPAPSAFREKEATDGEEEKWGRRNRKHGSERDHQEELQRTPEGQKNEERKVTETICKVMERIKKNTGKNGTDKRTTDSASIGDTGVRGIYDGERVLVKIVGWNLARLSLKRTE